MRMAFFLAGGFEPASHGFGVAQKAQKSVYFLAFSHLSLFTSLGRADRILKCYVFNIFKIITTFYCNFQINLL